MTRQPPRRKQPQPPPRKTPDAARGSRDRRNEPKTRVPKPTRGRGEAPAAEAGSPEPAAPRWPAQEPGRPIMIVGIGMSAGGLEACSQFLDALPALPGLAIVLVQHLSPHHASALPALLGVHTQMSVTEADDGRKVEPNRVYVIPPDVSIALVEGRLRLSPRLDEPGHLLPVDFFLKSLAVAQGDRAIAVILSGTGSDGLLGGRAIKAQGGTVFVQEPTTARYDGMPRSSISAGIADVIASPAEIAEKLVALAAHEYAETAGVTTDQISLSSEQLDETFELLRSASGGVDFSHYKQPTIRRRILRRMALNRLSDPRLYLELLKTKPQEARSLYQDVLIHVTRFFREPDSFAALSRDVLPKLLEQHKADGPLRVWVAGCATGEEAYSLAITLWEEAGDLAPELNVQIFGTDVSDTAVEFARQGQYPVGIADDISPERLRRFFSKVDGGYRINKVIRDRCVFARQDLTRDPPFSKLDLILCRNVLIYMDVALQRRLLPIFHYALRPNGYLVLGHAETVGTQNDLFALVDKKHKIYSKRLMEHPYAMPMPSYSPPQPPQLPVSQAPRADPRLVQNEANRLLLDRFSPPGVVVNANLEVVQFRGRTGPFLESPPGDASLNLLKLAREGLLHGLRSALQAARKSNKAVRREGLRVRSNGGWSDVDLEVMPIFATQGPHYLVLFEKREPRGRRGRPAPSVDKRAESRRPGRIEQELAATREYLQSIIQEVEAANEELQSANEEILSSNEELQSTNEELDTAKEELQSTNEELNTLNDELHARNEDLTRVNSDLVNLLGSVQIAVVIVSRDLRIRRFTPIAERMLNLIPTDIGRPITQVRPNFDCPQLGSLIMDVIDKVQPIERDVLDHEGVWYSLRIRPYKDAEHRIEGAVLALVDIDPVKRHELELQRAHLHAEAILANVTQPLAVLDSSLRVCSLNPALEAILSVRPGEAVGRSLGEVAGGPWSSLPFREFLQRALAHSRDGGGPLRSSLGEGPGALQVYAQPLEAAEDAERRLLLGVEQAEAPRT